MENMIKKEFLMLCDAHSNDIITTKQFKQILEGNFSTEKINAMLTILKYEDLANKPQIFNKLIEVTDAEVEKLKNLLKYKIYRTDLERQEYMLNNLQHKGFDALRKIVAEDFIWKRKKLLELLTQEIKSFENGRTLFTENLKELEETNPEMFDSPVFIPMLKKILKLEKLKYSENCLNLATVKSVQEKQDWLDYTIMYYNYMDNDKLPYGKYILTSLEEYDLMEIVNRKLDKLDTLELTKEEKTLVFKNFLTNLETIKDNWLGLEEVIPYISEIIDYALIDSPDYFPYLGEIVSIKSPTEKELFEEEILPLYEGIKRIRSKKVREATIDFLDNDSLTPEMFVLLKTANEREAQTIFMQQAIDNNNLEYQRKQNHFREKLPEEFLEYIKSLDFTKEELIQIRDRVQIAPLKFQENELYVNTENIIPESFQKIETQPRLETPIIEKKKTLKLNNPFKSIFRGQKK